MVLRCVAVHIHAHMHESINECVRAIKSLNEIKMRTFYFIER